MGRPWEAIKVSLNSSKQGPSTIKWRIFHILTEVQVVEGHVVDFSIKTSDKGYKLAIIILRTKGCPQSSSTNLKTKKKCDR